jgi:hypothetical protein
VEDSGTARGLTRLIAFRACLDCPPKLLRHHAHVSFFICEFLLRIGPILSDWLVGSIRINNPDLNLIAHSKGLLAYPRNVLLRATDEAAKLQEQIIPAIAHDRSHAYVQHAVLADTAYTKFPAIQPNLECAHGYMIAYGFIDASLGHCPSS